MLKAARIIFFFLIISLIISCSSAPSKVSDGNENLSGFDNERSRRMAEVQEKGGSDNNERMIAYTASLTLSVKNVDETREIILGRINDNDGFITRAVNNSITARIPAGNLDNFLNQVKVLGTVESESKTGVDITDQYRDNVIRLENLKNLRARYLALLEKANTIAEILSIEKELERINTEIDIYGRKSATRRSKCCVLKCNCKIFRKSQTRSHRMDFLWFVPRYKMAFCVELK